LPQQPVTLVSQQQPVACEQPERRRRAVGQQGQPGRQVADWCQTGPSKQTHGVRGDFGQHQGVAAVLATEQALVAIG